MPHDADSLQALCAQLGLKLRWFDKVSAQRATDLGLGEDVFVRSWFEAPNVVHLNRALRSQPQRLKYDLALYLGHKVLHDGDGAKSPVVADRTVGRRRSMAAKLAREQHALDSRDIVYAWRDFECSFFAGALLCPRIPFRRLVERHAHEVSVGEQIDVSPSVVMRRMTAVSSYPHWHYFDAYPSGAAQRGVSR